jgi:hypothetical protein
MNHFSTRHLKEEESWNTRAGGGESSSYYSDHNDEIPLQEQEIPWVSLYPSRQDIEDIHIPSCDEAFELEDERCREFFSARSFSSCFLRTSSPPRKTLYDSKPPGIIEDSHERYNSVSSRNHNNNNNDLTRSNSKGPPSSPWEFSQPGVIHVPATPVVPPRRGIEVSPGLVLPLHGAAETLTAVEQGRMLRTSCVLCSLHLQCIDLADYVLCPACHGVSPIEEHKKRKDSRIPSGVGLGLADTSDDHMD